ncbi:MAG: hypothetical protein AABX10_02245 [Nanoarchaeota archaeon]
MRRFFIFTYPKLTLYVIAIFVAYFVFQIPAVSEAVSSFDSFIYLPMFFGGLLYSAGFTTSLATGFFLSYSVDNILISALIGGLGALVADLGIFSFIRLSFMNEFHKLEKTSFIRHIIDSTKSLNPKIRYFFVYTCACIIIASPLPDELAVAMLAGFTKVHPYGFAFISYAGNFVGIYVLLSI